MADSRYLVERFGAGDLKVGSIVELTDKEAAFYSSKVRKIEDVEPAKLEVATPSAPTTAKDVIAAIRAVTNVDDLEQYAGDERASVKEAFDAKARALMGA